MNLLPVINVIYNNIAKTLAVQDITGFYNVTTNPTGYGAPNLIRSNITDARLIVNLNDEIFLEHDVTVALRNSLSSTVDFGVLPREIDKDGVYKTFLRVNTFSSFGIATFVNEEVNRLMCTYWARLASNYDIYKKKELEEECVWLESNIQGLLSLQRRGMEAEYINLLGFIEKRFEVNKSLFI